MDFSTIGIRLTSSRERKDIPGPDVGFLIEAPVKLGALIGPLEYSFEFFDLEFPDFFVWNGFEDGIPVSSPQCFFVVPMGSAPFSS